MNGAGTGMEVFRLRLGLLVRHRAITEFYVVVLCITLPAAAGLLAVSTTTRAAATVAMASAWFAPRSSTLVIAV